MDVCYDYCRRRNEGRLWKIYHSYEPCSDALRCWTRRLLVDADDQETATDFTNLRNETRPSGAGYTCVALTGGAVMTEIKRLAPKYQEIIVDTGGRDTASQRAALAVCDPYLVPFVPRSFDVWTLDKVVALIEEARSVNPTFQARAFLNRATPGALTMTMPPSSSRPRRDWSSCRRSWLDGKPLAMRRPPEGGDRDPASGCQAIEEIGILFEHLFNIQKISPLKRAVGQ